MKRLVLTGAACLIAGILLGPVFRGIDKTAAEPTRPSQQPMGRETSAPQTVAPPRRHPDHASKALDAEELVRSLQGQIRRLTQENQSLKAKVSTVTSATVDESTMLIPKRLIPRLSLEAISDGYTVGQDVVDVLGITNAEKEQVERALINARARLDELEIKHSTVLSQTATVVELSIPPFASDGEAIRIQLLADIRKALGDQRSDFFAEFAGQTIDDRFNHFGQASQNVKLTREEDGRMRLDTQFTIKTPQMTSSGGRSQSYDEARIPENYLHLFDEK